MTPKAIRIYPNNSLEKSGCILRRLKRLTEAKAQKQIHAAEVSPLHTGTPTSIIRKISFMPP
jgi:hypothetical protein